MRVKFTTTTKGEMAILPRAEYERLKNLAREAEEDLGTARLVSRAKKHVASREPLFPKEVADRLAKGENPIRVLREFRGYTQAQLVSAIGITQGYLSDLEAGKRKGPMELHQKIAHALETPLELLTPISVSLAEADPRRSSRRKQIVRQTRQARGVRDPA